MKFPTTVLTASLLGLLPTVMASEGYHYYSNSELTVMACKESVFATAQFCPKDTKSKYACNCKNQPAMGSLLYCIYDKMGKHSEEGEKIFAEYCHKVNVTLTEEKMRNSYENATKYIVDTKKISGFNKSEISYAPVYFTPSVFNNSFKSNKARFDNLSNSMYMGAGLMGYWGLIFLVATIYNFLSRAIFVQKRFKSGFINTIRKYISLPALVGRKHSEPIKFLKVFQGLVPTRWESIVLFGYFVLMFVFSGVRYQYVPNNTIWKTREGQAARYPGDRTGILLVFSLQFTFLFVGRNNFLIWLTGWKQSTFYTYHKWISRFNFILMLIHAGSMHCQSVGLGKLGSRMLTNWYRVGILAATAMGLMFVLACYQLRKASYEVFLAFHLALATIFLGASWKHIQKFGYAQFAYAMAAVWVFDRVTRLARIAVFGIKIAKVTVVSDEILKIVVPKHKHWKSFAGSFGYVSFLRGTTFFQSHPFTIVENHENEIVFYAKIKGGVTSATHKYLDALPGKTGFIKVAVEGPYGNPIQIKRYDTALCYTGGTGIASPFSHILDMLESKTSQHIKLYWTIRTLKSLEWFKEELLKLKDTSAQVIIYVTKLEAPSITEKDSFSGSGEKEEKVNISANIAELDFIEFRQGRPCIDELVKADLEESTGTVAVLTTAHNSLVDDVRASVAENLNLAKGRVDYFEDLQVW